jgi:uncharacterized membrane protein
MDSVEKRIVVDAPILSVFRFVNEPFNLLRLSPSIMEITDVVRLKNGGRNFKCVSKMADTRIYCTIECVEHVMNQCISYKISGGLHGSIRWLFEAHNEHTQVSLVLEYEVPLPLLKHHAESEIIRRNEHDIQQLLSNLKTVVEKQPLVRE